MRPDLEKAFRLAEALQTARDPFAIDGAYSGASRAVDAQRSRDERRAAILRGAALAVICAIVWALLSAAAR